MPKESEAVRDLRELTGLGRNEAQCLLDAWGGDVAGAGQRNISRALAVAADPAIPVVTL